MSGLWMRKQHLYRLVLPCAVSNTLPGGRKVMGVRVIVSDGGLIDEMVVQTTVQILSLFCSLSSGWWRDLLWSRWHHHKHRNDWWRLVEGCLQRPIRVVSSELCGAKTIETIVYWLCLNSPVNKSDLIHYKSWCFSEDGGVYTYCFYI